MMLNDIDEKQFRDKYLSHNKNSILKIGLTGGIGSGKSTISSILRDRSIDIIDADVLAREVLNIYPDILIEIKNKFGDKFIDEFGNLKRREFGNYIFSAPKKYREEYEKIIVPYIKKDICKKINEYEKQGKKLCVLDAATLIENNVHELMDITLLVWVNKHTQIERVKNRDKLTEEQVLDRINAQMTLEEKRKVADLIIDNSSSLDETKNQIDKFLKRILINDL